MHSSMNSPKLDTRNQWGRTRKETNQLPEGPGSLFQALLTYAHMEPLSQLDLTQQLHIFADLNFI